MDEATQSKVCSVCRDEKPLAEFNRRNASKDGLDYRCKPCHREAAKQWQRGSGKARHAAAVRRYFQTEAGRESLRRSDRRQYAKAPERRRARNELNDAIREGKITRLARCCGCGTDDRPIQGHHWSYERAHWLDVTWLCSRCHTAIHRAIEKAA